MTNHPLPWRVITGSRAHWVKDANTETVFAALKSHDNEEERVFLERAVHAVNHHQELVDALDAALPVLIGANEEWNRGEDDCYSDALEKARAILAKLEATK
jgi:hypothetical protein